MKYTLLSSFVCFLFFVACTEQIDQEKITDPTENNMKIIPANPGINTQISLVIYDDCTYNTLSGIKLNGKTIEIEKQFNSMMKWPCWMRNDTILIGKLSEGAYSVNYKLKDIASQTAPVIALSVTFNLLVSK